MLPCQINQKKCQFFSFNFFLKDIIWYVWNFCPTATDSYHAFGGRKLAIWINFLWFSNKINIFFCYFSEETVNFCCTLAQVRGVLRVVRPATARHFLLRPVRGARPGDCDWRPQPGTAWQCRTRGLHTQVRFFHLQKTPLLLSKCIKATVESMKLTWILLKKML